MKKIIAAGLAILLLPPAVFAAHLDKVTIYGSVRAFFDYIDNDKRQHVRLRDGHSRLGFLGSESINPNMSLVWQLESSLNIGKGEWGFAERNSFIGVASRWGTLRMGHFDSAYSRMDNSGPQAELFDSFGAPVDPKHQWGFYGRANTRQRNVVSYETPSLGGMFIGRISYMLDEHAQTSSNGAVTALSGTFSQGRFHLGIGYQHSPHHFAFHGLTTSTGLFTAADDQKTVETGSVTSTAYKIASNYKFANGLNIGVGAERIQDRWGNINPLTNSATLQRQDTYFVATQYPLNNYLLHGGYGWASKLFNSQDGGYIDETSARMAFLGGQYSMSKRSSLYTYLLWVDNDKNASFSAGYDSLNIAESGGAIKRGYSVSFGLRTDF